MSIYGWFLLGLTDLISLQSSSVQFISVTQSCPTLCDPWTEARKVSLSITNSQSLLILMSIESVMPSSRLILCLPLLLPPTIFPSIRVFSNESAGQHSPFLCGGQMDQHTLSEAIFLFWSEFITFPRNFDLLQELLKFLPTWRGRAQTSSSHCPPEGSS